MLPALCLAAVFLCAGVEYVKSASGGTLAVEVALCRKIVLSILMDFPNDSERSCVIGHHFDSTV